MTITTLVAGPSLDPTAHPLDHESDFCLFLRRSGYRTSYEQTTFPLRRERGGKSADRFTPDVRIVRLPDGTDVSMLLIFLELTEADLYLKATDLPVPIRRKNRRHSRSRRAYITPEQYLKAKRSKIKRAKVQYPDLQVLLLPHYEQLALMADGFALDEQINELVAAAQRRLKQPEFFKEHVAALDGRVMAVAS